mgnify:CR=1 FL=1
MKKLFGSFAGALGVLIVAVFSGCFFTVKETEHVIITRFGDIVGEPISSPGLRFKMPFIDTVNRLEKRLLNWDGSPITIPTKDKAYISVDTFARWRITDPSEYIRNVGVNERAGALQLNRVVRNSFQQEVNKRTVNELLSTRREDLMADVKREVLEAVRGAEKPWGMDVVDVRITRVDYAESITASVYQRMEAERKRVANELRSTGFAEGEKIRADADRQREVIVSEAYRDAQRIKGEGDAKAAASFSEAFGRDPAFAQFYRSLDAYRASFAGKSDVMVVDPSSDFFKALRSSNVAK